jgi:broad specificity phosphatase PhoE
VSRLILVRHGEAAAGWGDDHDPGLSPRGRDQAAAAAAALAPLGPLPIVTSPLRRTRETAGALEAVWDSTAEVIAAVGEIASPSDDLSARRAWLSSIMGSTWSDLGHDLLGWRAGVLAALGRLAATVLDTVVVTHFVAINVAVGAATGDDRVMCFAPANCSRTVLSVDAGKFVVELLGDQAISVVR